MSWSGVDPRVRARLRQAVFKRDGYQCQVRLPGCTGGAEHADHIAPREVAGDGLDNLRSSCAHCNVSRGDPRKGDPRHKGLSWL